jgi:lysophospholipase L1-like esterase
LPDGIHFTFTGGKVFASRIWPVIEALGHQQMAQHSTQG